MASMGGVWPSLRPGGCPRLPWPHRPHPQPNRPSPSAKSPICPSTTKILTGSQNDMWGRWKRATTRVALTGEGWTWIEWWVVALMETGNHEGRPYGGGLDVDRVVGCCIDGDGRPRGSPLWVGVGRGWEWVRVCAGTRGRCGGDGLGLRTRFFVAEPPQNDMCVEWGRGILDYGFRRNDDCPQRIDSKSLLARRISCHRSAWES